MRKRTNWQIQVTWCASSTTADSLLLFLFVFVCFFFIQDQSASITRPPNGRCLLYLHVEGWGHLAPCLRLHLEDVFGTRVRLRGPICAGTFGRKCICVRVLVVCRLFPYGRAVFWQSWSKQPCMLIADHSKKSEASPFPKSYRKSQSLQSTKIAGRMMRLKICVYLIIGPNTFWI